MDNAFRSDLNISKKIEQINERMKRLLKDSEELRQKEMDLREMVEKLEELVKRFKVQVEYGERSSRNSKSPPKVGSFNHFFPFFR